MIKGSYIYFATDEGPRVWHVKEALGNGILVATGVKSFKTKIIDVAEALYGDNRVFGSSDEMADFMLSIDETESAEYVWNYAIKAYRAPSLPGASR